MIGFSKLDFHHLIGLGKLKDLRIAKQNRGSVFDEIIIESTTYDTLMKSRYLPQIENDPHPVKRTTKKYKDFTRHRKYAVLCNRRFG